MIDQTIFQRAIDKLADEETTGKWEPPYKTRKFPPKFGNPKLPTSTTVPLLDAVPIRKDVAKMISSNGANVIVTDYIPHYSADMDEVRVPHPSTFVSEDSFYHTLFHELGHWTGRRLGRKIHKGFFTKKEIGAEEAIAELTAVFLCEKFGIKTHGSGAYVDSSLTPFAIGRDEEEVNAIVDKAVVSAAFLLKEKEDA